MATVTVTAVTSRGRCPASVPLVLRYDVLRGRRNRRIFDDQPVRAADSRGGGGGCPLNRNRMLVVLLGLLDYAPGTRGVHQAQGECPPQQEHDAL